MKKNGFTLVELLAVIVILAIILAIAIPSISGVIGSTTRSAFESNAKLLLKSIDYKLLENSSFKPSDVNVATIKDLLNLDDSNYQAVEVSLLDGKIYIVIHGKNKWSGLVAYGTQEDMQVVDSDDYSSEPDHVGYNDVKMVNTPVLATGMTPIKWNGTTWIDTTTSDSDWYNYTETDKKWANAKTEDGSMWVWIPRYIYKISSGWHSNTTGTIEIQFSKGIDDNWNSGITLNTDTTSNASNNTWTNHPAFDFGDIKLTGIWVAKFEASAAEGVANGYSSDGLCSMAGDNVTTKTIKILPNVTSWRCIQIGNAFTATRNMETNSVYGWSTASGLQVNGIFTMDINNIDTHLMKNIEWGAVSYLSKSSYGKNTEEIYTNNNQNYITGCASNTANASKYDGCQNTYESIGGVKASTTGNIYGIYDLSGGANERVSAYVDNGNSNLNTFGSSIINADNKYKDLYTKNTTDNNANNYLLALNKKGDAIYETSLNGIATNLGWFSDNTNMPNGGKPWFIRNSAFSFDYANGGTYSNSDGFRPVLVVNAGL